MKDTGFVGTTGYLNKTIDRQYLGGDVQVYYGDIPVIGGLTLRGEVVTGQQPGSSSGNGSPKSDIASSSAVYLRNFMGYYGMLVQNIDPIKSQLVLKYDVFDPNTDIEGTAIKSTTGLTSASFLHPEMAFTTVGVGLVFHWDENVKFIAYLDHVQNEEITSPIFAKDVQDDVFTFRIQYKF
jgi:hypothetical protein